jgi:voltage-gated potassium channel
MTPTLAQWRRWTDLPLVVLAIGSLPAPLLELKRGELAYADRVFIDVVNVTVLIAFAVDYLVELILARNRRRYVRTEWTSALVVLSQALALVPAAAGFGVLRVLRATRPLAVVARFVAVGGVATREGRAELRRHAAGLAIGVAGFTWIMSAATFTLAENVGVHGRVHRLAMRFGGQPRRSPRSATETLLR